jgi:hypothetical protein
VGRLFDSLKVEAMADLRDNDFEDLARKFITHLLVDMIQIVLNIRLVVQVRMSRSQPESPSTKALKRKDATHQKPRAGFAKNPTKKGLGASRLQVPAGSMGIPPGWHRFDKKAQYETLPYEIVGKSPSLRDGVPGSSRSARCSLHTVFANVS